MMMIFMCVIVITDKKINIIDAEMMNNANPHGIGVWSKQVGVKKFMDFDEFMNFYADMDNDKHVIHFRYATHGEIDEENIHPHCVDDRYVLFHNGIINIPIVDSKMSDTWHFAKYLSSHKDVKNAFIKADIGGNKMILVDILSNRIYTKGQFVKYKGYLVSNTNFLRQYLRYEIKEY